MGKEELIASNPLRMKNSRKLIGSIVSRRNIRSVAKNIDLDQ